MPTSDEYNVHWEPSDRTLGRADFDNARKYFSERTEDDWLKHFDRSPETVMRILVDMHQIVKTERMKAEGRPISGRRRKHLDPGETTIEELLDEIQPRYSMEPFPEAVRELIGKRSFNGFCQKVGIPRRTLDHMINGKVKLSAYWMARIARACDVSPAYFREYRELAILTSIAEVLVQNPNISVRWVKTMRGVA